MTNLLEVVNCTMLNNAPACKWGSSCIDYQKERDEHTMNKVQARILEGNHTYLCP